MPPIPGKLPILTWQTPKDSDVLAVAETPLDQSNTCDSTKREVGFAPSKLLPISSNLPMGDPKTARPKSGKAPTKPMPLPTRKTKL